MRAFPALVITVLLFTVIILTVPATPVISDGSVLISEASNVEDFSQSGNAEASKNSTATDDLDYFGNNTVLETFPETSNITFADDFSPVFSTSRIFKDKKKECPVIGNPHAPYDLEVLQTYKTLTPDEQAALDDAFNVTRTHSIPQLLKLMKTCKVPQYINSPAEDAYQQYHPFQPNCSVWSNHTLWRWRLLCDREGQPTHKKGATNCWNRAPRYNKCCDDDQGFEEWDRVCYIHRGGGWPPKDGGYDLRMCSKFCPMKRPGDCMIWHPKIRGLKMNDEMCLCKFKHCPGYKWGKDCTPPCNL